MLSVATSRLPRARVLPDLPWRDISIAIGIVVLFFAALSQPRTSRAMGLEKEDSPRGILQQWVEGYGMWSNRPVNANTPCPSPLTAQNVATQLKEYVNNASPKDKWGHELIFHCGSDLPAGVSTGFAVESLGPDGVRSDDDLRSWD